MLDTIRIIVTKGDTILDDVSLGFATVAEDPELEADALDVYIQASVAHLLKQPGFSIADNGLLWTIPNPAFDQAQTESETNPKQLQFPLSNARAVATALRFLGSKLVSAYAQQIVDEASAAARVKAAKIANSTQVIENV